LKHANETAAALAGSKVFGGGERKRRGYRLRRS
jgi:hypothetical protein